MVNDLRSIHPVWSPDSTRLAFAATRAGFDFNVYVRDVPLAGEAELLVDYEETIVPDSWSKDGRYLAVTAGELLASGDSDILIADLGSGEITPFLATDANESQAAFSPDGTWVAYMSNTPGTSRDQTETKSGSWSTGSRS